ncbi:receptor like protein 52 [Artemisia annua]|uniref:Receptor like protein 52 n=1 Tax=Artemisia annua TaxID=35608 RepID=A0A2U1QBZ4_ARTAN|nr:receptor like protein 52 [Artemisia annua]
MFSENVPFDSFSLPSLYWLDLSNNQLSGTVPFESFSLPSLKYLHLSGNQLGGQIDVQTFPQLTNLAALYLDHNNFSGELELDTLLSTLTNLEDLELSYSGFSVTTNNANHYIKPGFISLGLASCKLKVFPTFRGMKDLVNLDLSYNEIHGQIPHWAGKIGGQLPAKYFQNFNSMKNVVKNSTKPKYLDMGYEKYYSFVVAVQEVFGEAGILGFWKGVCLPDIGYGTCYLALATLFLPGQQSFNTVMLYETLLKKLKQRRALSNSNKGALEASNYIFSWGIGRYFSCKVKISGKTSYQVGQKNISTKKFHCNNGKAYLFTKVLNVTVGVKVDRLMMTGLHIVAGIFCVNCGTNVGWTYYKEGKSVLERVKLSGSDEISDMVSHEADIGGGAQDI